MFWALLSGIGACADAAYYIVNKKYLQSTDPNLLAASGFLFTSLFLLLIALARGIPPLGPDFMVAVAATCAINVVGTTLVFRALESTDISLAVPMLSFTPLFLLLTAALMLGEIPSPAGITGIVVIVTGSYILNTAAEHTRFLDPFRAMIAHPGIFSMLVVSFLYAISIGFDKMVVLNSDTVFGSGIVLLILGSVFLFIFLLKRRIRMQGVAQPPGDRVHVPDVLPDCPRHVLTAGIVIGAFLTLEAIAINAAYLVQIVPYVSAIKRMSILITVLYGTVVIQERELFRRVAGAGMMLEGVILILLFP